MVAWQEAHPEEKPETMGDHLRIMNKFGFDMHVKLTEEQKKIKGNFVYGKTEILDSYSTLQVPCFSNTSKKFTIMTRFEMHKNALLAQIIWIVPYSLD